MLLIPVVALKLGSAGWRMLRYYLRGAEYVRRGPPHPVMRVLVAPVVVVSTMILLATGVVLLVRDETRGTILMLHKASFVVWIGATGVHVLAHLQRLARILPARIPGAAARVGLVGCVLAAGAVLATATLPAADRLQDHATVQFGLDDR